MKVSIIIPVYNAQDSVGKCLDSILNQSSGEWEAVVINDGSSDDSWKVLERYASRYPEKIRNYYTRETGEMSEKNLKIRKNYGKNEKDILQKWFRRAIVS